MLTDYHLHLRSDDLDRTADGHFTAENAARYRQLATERGIAELGVSEHIYRFRQALSIWEHPFWVENAIDDLDAYCAFVRERTDLRLGIEADFIDGAEDRIRALLQRHDFDYVVGSVHFLTLPEIAGQGAAGAGAGGSDATAQPGFGTPQAPRAAAAVDMPEWGIWRSGLDAEQIWSLYFQTLARAARSGLFDILAHPDLVKVFGPAQPTPAGDLWRFYEPAAAAIAESGVALEVSTAGLRKAVAEIYPSEQLLSACVRAGVPIALSSDAHRPEEIGADYEQALALLKRLGVRELCVFARRSRRLEPIGRTP